MAINISNLFTELGKWFYVGERLEAAATDIKAELEDALQALPTGIEFNPIRNSSQSDLDNVQNSLSMNLISNRVRDLVIITADNDNPLLETTALNAVKELIEQMEDQSETVDATVPSDNVAYDGGNAGDGVLVTSIYRKDGSESENVIGEDFEGKITTASSDGTATLRLIGEQARSPLSALWPAGSGTTKSVTSLVGSSGNNLISSGTFETEDANESELPTGWIAETATLGTTVKLTDVEVQTVIVSGTPTGGHYVLHFTNHLGDQQSTVPLAYNASESDVQTALRSLVGMENVTVATTGTSPDFTHTITFTEVTNPSQLTSTDNLTGGAPNIAHATTTAASANVSRGARALELDSDGAENTDLYVAVSLSSKTQYAINLLAMADVVPAAGVITVSLVDGITGTVVQDDAGTSNSFTIDCTVLTTSFTSRNSVWRTPTTMPLQTYVRIEITTPISGGTSVFIDELILAAMTEMYTDGPSVALFTGDTKWIVGDELTYTVSTDRGGKFQEWFDRIFNMRQNRLLLPSAGGALETVDDALIA